MFGLENIGLGSIVGLYFDHHGKDLNPKEDTLRFISTRGLATLLVFRLCDKIAYYPAVPEGR